MLTQRKAVDIVIWSVSELIDATSKPAHGNTVVTIPDFQRRLVWPKKKQAELISSIQLGYPFGSIMLYEDFHKTQTAGDGKKYFSLIDGLQRTHALRSYVKNQNSFFSRTNLKEEFLAKVASALGKASIQGRAQVRRSIVKWVNGVPSFEAGDGWGSSGLLSALVRNVRNYPSDSQSFNLEFAKLSMDIEFQKLLGSFLDETSREARRVLDAKVPVMIYNGAPDDVPKVFRLLNSKGAQLTKYEILAAQWVNERQPIANQAVIDAIWTKIQAVEKEGFILEVAEKTSDDESKRRREYSLYDYLFGLGHILPTIFPRLFKPAKGDRPNADSFNLFTACFGLHTSQMGELPTKLKGLDLSIVEKCILQSVRFVDSQLKPLLSMKQSGRANPPIYHTEHMITSMIATSFQARFGVKDLSENDHWKVDRQTLKLNIPMFYLYEILQDDWRGSGDSKLFDRVREFRYLRQSLPAEDRWVQALDNWYYNHIDYVHGKKRSRHIYDNRPEYLLLRYIFAQQLQNAETYHVEHILPVSVLQNNMVEEEEWPINSIANLALLKIAGELRHNVQTFDVLLQDKRRRGEITEEQQARQLLDYEEKLHCPASILPKPLTKDSFEGFLIERFELLKREFFRVWRDHIPQSS